MRTKLWVLPFLCFSVMLISATTIKVQPKTAAIYDEQTSASLSVSDHKKLNFFERLMLKAFKKQYQKADSSMADKNAKSSLAFGIAACGAILIGLVIPYFIFLCIPAGILAMITGGSALRNNTSEIGKAKTGKALGLGALIAFGVLIIAAVIIVASLFRDF